MKHVTHRRLAFTTVVLVAACAFGFVLAPKSFALTNNTCQPGDAHCNAGATGAGGGGAADNTPTTQPNGTFNTGDNTDLGNNSGHTDKSTKTINDTCGGTVDGDDESVGLSINIGCRGKGNPVTDMLFAVIRILSDGVGLIVVGSIIVGGIQYTGSRGDPQSTAMAVNRIRSSVFALIIFIFGYAILNFIIPQGFFK
jgi:hypothetical protein